MTDTTMEKIDILPFRGCKFLCGEVNKIELAIRKGRNWRGHYRYDAANFSYDPRQHDPRGRLTYIGLKLLR